MIPRSPISANYLGVHLRLQPDKGLVWCTWGLKLRFGRCLSPVGRSPTMQMSILLIKICSCDGTLAFRSQFQRMGDTGSMRFGFIWIIDEHD